ncbi:MAG: alternative ribosome rescue aminoacyl-tRNA hydrolase ArfB [Spirochaetota bacterium]
MIDRESLRTAVEAATSFDFARSGGPGGQNVNKVNSRVYLRIDLATLKGITEADRSWLLAKLESRLIDGVLQITVQDERSQLLNKEIAIERALTIIVEGLHRPKVRRKTKPTKASKERRLTAKKSTSIHKANRSRPLDE